MNILVISDTHGNTDRAREALRRAWPVDVVVHLGDGCADAEQLRNSLDIPVVNVAGNCDLGCNTPRELLWACENKKILLTHGDLYGVKNGLLTLEMRARETSADAVLFGHSHLPIALTLPGLLMLNPGTLATASHLSCSFAIMMVTPGDISAQLCNFE
ncbi:MAG: YfcE family phosphodiesterase [Desulfuromonadales bacterium]